MPSGRVSRLTLQYDGTRFYGWSIQPGTRTVEGELTRALGVVLRRDDVKLSVAGRTDRGVHALGQVASYEGEPPLLRSINAVLPPDVAVVGAEVAPPGFSARHSALSRSYLYRIHTRPLKPSPFELGRALWWPHRMDVGALRACAAALIGSHDFTAFTPTETYHQRFQRIIHRASWSEPGPETLEFRIEADAFMRNMVRVIVGTMLEVAGGKRPLEDFTTLLRGAERPAAGETAPAHGLYLESVRY